MEGWRSNRQQKYAPRQLQNVGVRGNLYAFLKSGVLCSLDEAKSFSNCDDHAKLATTLVLCRGRRLR